VFDAWSYNIPVGAGDVAMDIIPPLLQVLKIVVKQVLFSKQDLLLTNLLQMEHLWIQLNSFCMLVEVISQQFIMKLIVLLLTYHQIVMEDIR
jgi:hypothetical protein